MDFPQLLSPFSGYAVSSSSPPIEESKSDKEKEKEEQIEKPPEDPSSKHLVYSLPPGLPINPARHISQKFQEKGLAGSDGRTQSLNNQWPDLKPEQQAPLIALQKSPIQVCGPKAKKSFNSLGDFLNDLRRELGVFLDYPYHKVKAEIPDKIPFTLVGSAVRDYIMTEGYLRECFSAMAPEMDNQTAFNDFLSKEQLSLLPRTAMDLDMRLHCSWNTSTFASPRAQREMLENLAQKISKTYQDLIQKEVKAVYSKRDKKSFISCSFKIEIHGEVKDLEITFVFKGDRLWQTQADRPCIELGEEPRVVSASLPEGCPELNALGAIHCLYGKELEIIDPFSMDKRCFAKFFSLLVRGWCFIGKDLLYHGEIRPEPQAIFNQLVNGLNKHCPTVDSAYLMLIQSFCMGLYPQPTRKVSKTEHLRNLFLEVSKIKGFQRQKLSPEIELIRSLIVEEGLSYDGLMAVLESAALLGWQEAQGNVQSDISFQEWALRCSFLKGQASLVLPFGSDVESALDKKIEKLIPILKALDKLSVSSRSKIQSLIEYIAPRQASLDKESPLSGQLLTALLVSPYLEDLSLKGEDRLFFERCHTDVKAWKKMAVRFPDKFIGLLLKRKDELFPKHLAVLILFYESRAPHNTAFLSSVWDQLTSQQLQAVFLQKSSDENFQDWVCEGSGYDCLLNLLQLFEAGSFIKNHPKLFKELQLLTRLEKGSDLHRKYTEVRIANIEEGKPYPKNLREAWLYYHPEDKSEFAKKHFSELVKKSEKVKVPFSDKDIHAFFEVLTDLMSSTPDFDFVQYEAFIKKISASGEVHFYEKLTEEQLIRLLPIFQSLEEGKIEQFLQACPQELRQKHKNVLSKLISSLFPSKEAVKKYAPDELSKEQKESWTSFSRDLEDSLPLTVSWMLNRHILLSKSWDELSPELIERPRNYLGKLTKKQVNGWKDLLLMEQKKNPKNQNLLRLTLHFIEQFNLDILKHWKLLWTQASEGDPKKCLLEWKFNKLKNQKVISESDAKLFLTYCLKGKFFDLLLSDLKNTQELFNLIKKNDQKDYLSRLIEIEDPNAQELLQRFSVYLFQSEKGIRLILSSIDLKQNLNYYTIVLKKIDSNVRLNFLNSISNGRSLELENLILEDTFLESLSLNQDAVYWQTLIKIASKSENDLFRSHFMDFICTQYEKGNCHFSEEKMKKEELECWENLLFNTMLSKETIQGFIFSDTLFSRSLEKRMPKSKLLKLCIYFSSIYLNEVQPDESTLLKVKGVIESKINSLKSINQVILEKSSLEDLVDSFLMVNNSELFHFSMKLLGVGEDKKTLFVSESEKIGILINLFVFAVESQKDFESINSLIEEVISYKFLFTNKSYRDYLLDFFNFISCGLEKISKINGVNKVRLSVAISSCLYTLTRVLNTKEFREAFSGEKKKQINNAINYLIKNPKGIEKETFYAILIISKHDRELNSKDPSNEILIDDETADKIVFTLPTKALQLGETVFSLVLEKNMNDLNFHLPSLPKHHHHFLLHDAIRESATLDEKKREGKEYRKRLIEKLGSEDLIEVHIRALDFILENQTIIESVANAKYCSYMSESKVTLSHNNGLIFRSIASIFCHSFELAVDSKENMDKLYERLIKYSELKKQFRDQDSFFHSSKEIIIKLKELKMESQYPDLEKLFQLCLV